MRDRLTEAAAQLAAALDEKSSAARRRRIVVAARHLIAWLAGDRSPIPVPNATNTADDSVCDRCFIIVPRGAELCKRCQAGRHAAKRARSGAS